MSVYFPGTKEVWYDADTYEKYTTNGNVKISVDMKKVSNFLPHYKIETGCIHTYKSAAVV